MGGLSIHTNLRKIDLNLLTIFDAVFRERHISRAAEQLGMSQSAVSHALGRLRDVLDDPLFIRHATGMEPTRRALEIAQPIHEALNDLTGILARSEGFDASNTKRTFTIALGDYCECLIMPPLMQWLERHAPHIQIVCQPDHGRDAHELFSHGNIDLFLDYMPIEIEGLAATTLFSEQLCVVASRTRTDFGEHLSLANFAAAKHVIFERHSDYGSLLDVALHREGIERNNVLTASSLVFMMLIAARSGLLASIPRRLALLFADSLDLQIYPLPVSMDALTIKMYWLQEQHDDPGHLWLRELVQRIASLQ